MGEGPGEELGALEGVTEEDGVGLDRWGSSGLFVARRHVVIGLACAANLLDGRLLWGWRRTIGILFGFAAGVERGVVVGLGGRLVLGGRGDEGLFQAFFGGGFGVGLGVADGEGGLVFGEGLLTFGVDVVEAAQVDVRPGEHAGVFRGVEGGLEVADGRAGLTLHEIDAGEDVVGAGVVAVGGRQGRSWRGGWLRGDRP